MTLVIIAASLCRVQSYRLESMALAVYIAPIRLQLSLIHAARTDSCHDTTIYLYVSIYVEFYLSRRSH